MEILETLNPAQLSGAKTVDGPVLVIAGAGSGKTKMITARVFNLMANHNVSGHNILAVTFTNKAAEEMRKRIAVALGLAPDALDPQPFFSQSFSSTLSSSTFPVSFSVPTIGTFHSICTRLLRRELERTPFTKQFVIYDDSDQLTLVKDCFTRCQLSEKSFSPKSFQWAINSAKCSAHEPHQIQTGGRDLFTENLVKVYTLYQQTLFKNNALDFGEIITMAYRVLRDNPELLEKYRNLYRFIHVDEYQDTNRAQYLLINLLAQRDQNICVVGDEDQSIYKWRGADIRNILDFEKSYPAAKTIKLEQNYRSTQTIINASSYLISNNSQRKEKILFSENETGAMIGRFGVKDERTEAELVIGMVKESCASKGYSFDEAAIFYRTNAQSRIFEDVLRREKIPYRVVGGLRFYDRKEIKDVMSYFRVLVNPEDSVSFKRIINVPQRGIGKTTVEKIETLAVEKGVTFEMAMRILLESKKTNEFLALIDGLRTLAGKKNIHEFYHELMDQTKYIQELKAENTEESASRIENLQELNTILMEFGFDDRPALQTLPEFLESVTLASVENEENAGATGAVNLMTLHTSKGLEFPLVFMVGMEEGLFPSGRATKENGDDEIEEERRLCYVGMTRAKKQLVMTHAVCRRIYGNIIYNDPARFFMEIPEKYIQYNDLTGFKRSTDDDDGLKFGTARIMNADAKNTDVGRRVRHSLYGEGVIKNIEGGAGSNPGDAKVTIEFSGRVVKKFIKKFANLVYL